MYVRRVHGDRTSGVRSGVDGTTPFSVDGVRPDGLDLHGLVEARRAFRGRAPV